MLHQQAMFEAAAKNFIKNHYDSDKIHFLSAKKLVLVDGKPHVHYIELATGKEYLAIAGEFYDQQNLETFEVNNIRTYKMSLDLYMLNDIIVMKDEPNDVSYTYADLEGRNTTDLCFSIYKHDDEYYVGQCAVKKFIDDEIEIVAVIDELRSRIFKTVKSSLGVDPKFTTPLFHKEFLNLPTNFLYVDKDYKAHMFVDEKYRAVHDTQDIDEVTEPNYITPTVADVVIQAQTGNTYIARIIMFDYPEDPMGYFITYPFRLKEIKTEMELSKDVFKKMILDENDKPFYVDETWSSGSLNYELQVDRLIHVDQNKTYSYQYPGKTFSLPLNIRFKLKENDENVVLLEIVTNTSTLK